MRGESNKNKWLHLRLSSAEYRILMKKRASSTCRNVSQFVRNVIFDRPLVTTYRNLSQDDMVHQMAMLNRELNALGNNLNQITKKLHTLQPSEADFWALQFSIQAKAILSQIVQIQEVIQKMAERWLR